MKTIALCMNTPEMDKQEYKNPDYGKKYRGAGWMRHLVQLALKSGMQVIDGKTACDLDFDPKDVFIVQEELNRYGIELQKRGAHKAVLLCCESPIYAAPFYDYMANPYHQTWRHHLLFNGSKDHLYFPSFDSADILEPLPFSERKFMCQVMSNKHYSTLGDGQKDSPTFNHALETELHTYRYSAVGHFITKSGYDLYGHGWPNEMAHPIEDKLQTIHNYQFALCFENGSYPGYITEKIIDCFVAGVVPVYAGAPDVQDYIPQFLYINANGFKSFEAMEEYLRTFGQAHYEDRVRSAQNWLRNGSGQNYNNHRFAERILSMCG